MKRIFSFLFRAFRAFLGIYFFLIPAGIIIHDLSDPGLKNGLTPDFTYRWHENLSPRFERWALDRSNSNQAEQLDINNISGTEWPMFGSVYYLWATEALQENWNSIHSSLKRPTKEAPSTYAELAIEAAAKLIVDPENANWVKQHWGNEYLQKENLFYRMLLISGLTSYQNLSGNTQYEELLRQQTRGLRTELSESPFGLLDDYPGQCYPVDVLPAIAVIQRAEALLGEVDEIELRNFVSQSQRGFSDSRIDPETGLPAYIANASSGEGYGPARGVGISYMLIWAPELWPEVADDWYKKYKAHFWKQNTFIAGFTEFSASIEQENFYFDVDAGPVLWSYGAAASAFGLGAARVNDQMEEAYPLAAEAIAFSWPLPDGTLLVPRLLSNLSEAPYLGESALLFIMTRTPANSGFDSDLDVKTPLIVYILLCIYVLFGAAFVAPLTTTLWRSIFRSNPKHD